MVALGLLHVNDQIVTEPDNSQQMDCKKWYTSALASRQPITRSFKRGVTCNECLKCVYACKHARIGAGV